MFAVVKTGGKQYRVEKDSIIKVEKLDVEAGKTVKLEDVLMIGDGANSKVGAPTVKGAAVSAKVLDQIRDRKIIVFKKKRRQNYRRKQGHRQHLTILQVTNISGA